ncbi:MAG TPA: DUF4097 family beta strand repeat-containing protein [Blastocatellia bacterium]|nr:DUF4097 family beta strand repeat-containing protein [Blastocatellia bacterium]
MLKKLAIVFAIVLLTSVAARASNNGAQKNSAEGASVERYLDEDCQQMQRYSMTDLPVRLIAQEEKRIPRSAVEVLNVEGSRNGGVSIKGWSQPDILVKACKLAGAETKEEAQALLDQLTISTDNGKVRSETPAKNMNGRHSWVVQFRIYVPRDLAVEAAVHNGGLALSELVGKVNGRSQNGGISFSKGGGTDVTAELYAVNGGISLSEVEGKVNARTSNGGISLSGGRGEIKLNSQNGGITIRLPEGQWSGETLEAHSDNGGLTLEVPQGFASGIEAEVSSHAPLECRLPECNQGQRDGDESRKRVQIGGSPVVHVSTRNGNLRIVPSR